ncbi:DNA helicase [Desulforamulus aeronauticus]|nr:DNA helicase [Desulforamulus aeronauticus]
MKRISHIITANEVLRWSPGDIITITAGTGAGKSYFIKNILYDLCKQNNKKILMLIHRINCVDQFRKEIEKDKKTDTIDIKTYQSLENSAFFDFSEYEYIVNDEFHYFLGDAAFNIKTDISLDMILAQNDKKIIFMSATGDYMKRYINYIRKINTIDYELPIEFKFIKSLTFFNKNETLEKFIEEAIEKKDKGIFFIQSVEKAYNLYKKYENVCLFNCSKNNNKGFYKYVDQKKIADMLQNEMFEEQILITTTCLDAGVNINDKNVKHVVLDVQDIGVLIQCLGRRRIQNDDDKINVYIKTITNQQLGGMETQLKNKIKKADYLRKHTVKEYLLEYPRAKSNDYSNIVYDDIVKEDDKGTKKINELMYFKCKFDLNDIAEMKVYGEYGYCKYLQNLFKYEKDYRTIEEDYKSNDLENYLASIKGQVMLQLKDREELIKKIDVKSNGKLLRKIYNLNGALEEMEIPYRIIEFPTSKIINGKKKNYKSAWRVEQLVS